MVFINTSSDLKSLGCAKFSAAWDKNYEQKHFNYLLVYKYIKGLTRENKLPISPKIS